MDSEQLQTLLEDYLDDCRLGNCSPRTIENYRQGITRFINWTETHPTPDPFDPSVIRRYLAELATNHSPSGVNMHRGRLQTWTRWLWRQGTIPLEPFSRIRSMRLDIEPLQPVAPADVKALLRACEDDTIGQRDRALILTLYDSGLRATELINLNVRDVDLDTGALTVRKAKSRRFRVTFVGERTRQALGAFLEWRHAQPDDALFPAYLPGRADTRLTTNGLRAVIARRARDARIKPPSLHSFRRAFALNLLRSGADAVSISRMLGHKDLRTITRYLAQTAEDLQRVHRAHSPADKL